ncbi:TrkH family potassium uptake protein [Boudabousia marimammalium]|uniref:Potassium transporter Trk n=1 Tax=Boudabousia marimammalium TaxID=156892 RepID=A0A1Q5PMC6_9ACTO|nr:potassium transporter TrkG [Boudabousia marimammalium]OKL48701.1 hypothetical protein BM477_05765 [Boudabousia marimammalium]
MADDPKRRFSRHFNRGRQLPLSSSGSPDGASSIGFKAAPDADTSTQIRYATSKDQRYLHVSRSRTQMFREFFERMARDYPARLALSIFAGFILFMTGWLMLPISTASRQSPSFADALFTATSAVCVTGLSVQDTITYWSIFGQIGIAVGIAVGGLGIMTLSSILAMVVSRRIGLASRMLAASERKTQSLGSLGPLLKAVILTSVICEGVLFAIFLPRFLTMKEDLLPAIWHSIFMSISTFNNAGFETIQAGLSSHVEDVWMLTPIALGTVVGALGFPVIHNMWQYRHSPRHWTLHTKLTISTYGIIAALSFVLIPLSEWSNPKTFGGLSWSGKLANAFLGAVNTRSTGLSALDIGEMSRSTWLLQDIFMFIGGGSGSTAGGVKVTTIAVLVLAVVAEARGSRDIEAFERKIPTETVRVAVSIVLISTFTIVVAVWLLMQMTNYSLDALLFESISAFGTVGLSTGISMARDLPDGPKYVLTALMFFGRTGTMTVAAALAMTNHRRLFHYPPESPAVG